MMPEEFDPATTDFNKEIAPQVRPRDQAGKFIREGSKPEPIFQSRAIEGDPETGDTNDGGDDERLRAQERSIADGHEQGQRREPAKDAQNLRRPADDAEDDEFEGDVERLDQPADEQQELQLEDEGEKYEIIVGGETRHVTLNEALRGYIDRKTLDREREELGKVRGEMEANANDLVRGWAMWHKAKRDYEEDLANLLPREPDWDQEFARDPKQAHDTQKVFQVLYAKYAESQRLRAEREAIDAAEAAKRIREFAEEGWIRFSNDAGFTKFLRDSKLPDKEALRREILSMRRTAADAGFGEQEVGQVYDPRMLITLWWASRFRRMTAPPKAVVSGKGKTLTPGAASPLGNVRRAGLDDAQRQLASSGRLDDAAEVFRRLL